MMKIFDFRCGECDQVYEAFVRSEETPKCKHCGAEDNQHKLLGVGRVYATNDDSPKSTRDLQHYLGNGQYVPGYKR